MKQHILQLVRSYHKAQIKQTIKTNRRDDKNANKSDKTETSSERCSKGNSSSKEGIAETHTNKILKVDDQVIINSNYKDNLNSTTHSLLWAIAR